MFIAKNNDLIILVKETREELEQALLFMNYTSIEETDIDYIYYNNKYISKEEEAKIEREKEIKKRKQEILNELDKLDLKSIRAIRANDTEYIEKYEKETKELREELKNI